MIYDDIINGYIHGTSRATASGRRDSVQVWPRHRADPWQEAFLKAPERSKGSRDPLLRVSRGAGNQHPTCHTCPTFDPAHGFLLNLFKSVCVGGDCDVKKKPFKHIKAEVVLPHALHQVSTKPALLGKVVANSAVTNASGRDQTKGISRKPGCWRGLKQCRE